MAGTVKAVFLDRDGVINPDPGWINSPEQLQLFPFTGPAIRRLNENGFLVVVVTNQSVVARGRCSLETVETIHQHLRDLLAQHNAHLDGIYVCPHHPKFDPQPCTCRKPSPELVLRAMKELKIEAEGSVFVGDKMSDIEAGRRAGIRTIMVTTGEAPDEATTSPDLVVANLEEAVDRILDPDPRWART